MKLRWRPTATTRPARRGRSGSGGWNLGAGTWLVWSMLVVVGLLAVAPLVGDSDAPYVRFIPILGALAFLLPVVVSWSAYRKAQSHRTQWMLVAAAVTLYTFAVSCFYLSLVGIDPGLFRVLSFLGAVSFYLVLLVALSVLVYRQEGRFSWAVALDCSVGALGTAAVLALVLGPDVETSMLGAPALDRFIAIAIPLLDLVVLASIAGIRASKSIAVGRGWVFLVCALLVFSASDIALSLNGFKPAGSYTTGTLLDSGWTIGLALIALWMHLGSRSDGDGDPRENDWWAMALPVAATTSGLIVLVLATQVAIPDLAVVLAAGTVLLASLRTTMAFQELRRLSDVRQQASTDELTGLPNRRSLNTEVPLLLARGGRDPQALLLLDLDRFKEVNDSLGHEVGDRLLQHVARRLSRGLRSRDILARVGGDEFAILLDGCGQEAAETVAKALCAALTRPHALKGISVQTGASIGIALFPEHGQNLTALMRKADVAMYRAKATSSGHHVYTDADDRRGKARLQTLHELRLALTSDQLEVHYQPRIEPQTGEVLSVQSHIRWNHPERGLLLPSQFLALVDDPALRSQVRQLALGKALDQVTRWHAQGIRLSVSVDLSECTLLHPDLPERTIALLEVRGLPSSALIVEITEAALLEDRDRSNRLLGRLRAQGVRIAVADFGTGHSSLAYLRELPLDELMLDESFVLPMVDDARASALAASTIALAHSLGLRMVAEGVASAAALDLLARYGCDEVQGPLVSCPVPAAGLERWLVGRGRPTPAPASV